ncbi:MAG: FkbM family methyltransferase [Chryseolinea sp.]
MGIYYSQHGEDFLLDRIFEGKSDGFFVEVGCLDGIEFSNSYFFEEKGWTGLCIEPHRDFLTALRKNRPRSTVVPYAIGEEDRDDVTFYANKLGSLSTLDKGEEKRWEEDYKDFFFGFEEQKVSVRKLTTVFMEQGVTEIDFLSLDIEGFEIFALKGLDLKKFRPKVFVIEYKNDEQRQQIENMLTPHGYFYLGNLGCNSFFSLEKSHSNIINGTYGTIKLAHIDMDGTRNMHTANLLRPSFVRKATYHLKRILGIT